MSFESLRSVIDEARVSEEPTIPASAPVSAAIAMLKERDLEALMVVDAGRVAGVFTVREALACVASGEADATPIGDALMVAPVSADVSMTVTQALELMNERRSRYVTVWANARMLGILSKDALTGWVIRNQQEQLDCAIRAVKRIAYTNRRM